MKKSLLSFFLLIGSGIIACAQENKISAKDAADMISTAQYNVQKFGEILNEIANSQFSQADVDQAKKSSYTYPRQILYNEQITVEDDVDPESGSGNEKIIDIMKYYNEFDTQYQKSEDDAVEFTNIDASNVKRNDKFYFILVKFDSQFKNKYLPAKSNYPIKRRLAIVRIEYEGRSRWTALITNIKFYDPRKPITSTEDNVQVFTDTSATASIVSSAQLDESIKTANQLRAAEDRRNNELFKRNADKGDSAMTDKRYQDAINAYQTAQDLKPLDVSLEKKIAAAKMLQYENSYDFLYKEAGRFTSERRYDQAIAFYTKAVDQKPEKSNEITAAKAPLITQLNIIAPPQNMLKTGNYKGAIEESNALLKQHKKEKEKFPELFLILAEAYSLKYLANDDVSGSEKNALLNYDLAIQYFPNYFDARIARANFLVTKNPPDYTGAITDYDSMIRDLSDKDPEYAVFVTKKANLDDRMGRKDDAIADYTKAIALQPKIDSFYFERGELYYSLKKYDQGKKDFDVAIRLNPQYSAAYYYRGLNYTESNFIYLAGQDFSQLDKLGVKPEQLKKIQSISDNFLFKGDSLNRKHEFAIADSAYDNALKIRPCNAKAFHGKAQISFKKADEFSARSKNDDAKKNYLQSIALNRKAVHCDTTFSDAYLIEGLTQSKLKQYDQAIDSYTKAVSSDGINIQAILERGNVYEIQQAHDKAQGDYSDAIARLKSALDTTKNKNQMKMRLSFAYQLDGVSRYNNKDYKNALISLNSAIDYDKYNADARYYKGLVLTAQNNLSDAISSYTDAIEISPKYNYYYDRGIAYYRKKNYDQAIKSFDKSIDLDTLHVEKNTFHLKGLSYYKDKQYDLAVTDFSSYDQSAYAKNDETFYADYGLAELYLKHPELAVKYLNQALTLTPDNAMAHYGMGCVFAATGQFDKAMAEFEKAFSTHHMHKDDIKLHEDTFLEKFKDDKNRKKQYNQLKQDINDE